MRVLLATRSHHKAEEIRGILGSRVQVVTLEDAGLEWLPEEEGLEPYGTFEANARSKAKYFFERSGLPTMADDSGLEVDALGGAPGVHTKRFAPPGRWPGLDQDEANNRFLLERLSGVEPSDRRARYVCVAVLIGAGGSEERVCRGEAPGWILESPKGEGGFGYDPLFWDDELQRAFAELTPDEKNRRSHRGRAFRALLHQIEDLLPTAGPFSGAAGAQAGEDGIDP